MTTYSTQVHSYFDFGSVHSETLSAESLKALKVKMQRVIEEETVERTIGKTELVTFSPITKTVSKPISEKGYFVKCGKITNRYWGKDSPAKWFNPLDIGGKK